MLCGTSEWIVVCDKCRRPYRSDGAAHRPYLIPVRSELDRFNGRVAMAACSMGRAALCSDPFLLQIRSALAKRS